MLMGHPIEGTVLPAAPMHTTVVHMGHSDRDLDMASSNGFGYGLIVATLVTGTCWAIDRWFTTSTLRDQRTQLEDAKAHATNAYQELYDSVEELQRVRIPNGADAAACTEAQQELERIVAEMKARLRLLP